MGLFSFLGNIAKAALPIAGGVLLGVSGHPHELYTTLCHAIWGDLRDTL